MTSWSLRSWCFWSRIYFFNKFKIVFNKLEIVILWDTLHITNAIRYHSIYHLIFFIRQLHPVRRMRRKVCERTTWRIRRRRRTHIPLIGMDSRAVTSHAVPAEVPAPAAAVPAVMQAAAPDRIGTRVRVHRRNPRSSSTRRNTRRSRRRGRTYYSRRAISRARSPGPAMRAPVPRRPPRRASRRHIPPQVESCALIINQKSYILCILNSLMK